MKRRRLEALLVAAALTFALLTARLWALQVRDHRHYADRAEDQQNQLMDLVPPRGTIFDAAGRQLAVSVPTDTVYAIPGRIGDPEAFAEILGAALERDPGEIVPRLAGRRGWVLIERRLERERAARVRRLERAELAFEQEFKRYYPLGPLAAQVLGFAGAESNGLGGLEQAYDATVAGKAVERRVLRDGGGRLAVSPELGWATPEPGDDLHLTLDASIQHIAERELERAVDATGAVGGSVVILDPWTGAVMAMASRPTFDPNRFGEGEDPAQRWQNRSLTDAIEPGSAFKMVTAAAALEAGIIDPSDLIDCQMGAIIVHGKRIRDHKPFGVLSFREVMANSSNVGTIKVGLELGAERLYRQTVAFGFGARTGIDLPGENPGLLRPLESWQVRTPAYVSFGQGIAVTGLQLASAFAAVANGGVLLEPYVVAAIGADGELRPTHPEPRVLGRPMSPATARQLGRLLEGVVTEGTGTRAAVEGYRVAGKTGTAQRAKEGGGGYSASEHVAVFVGYAPARRPAFVAAILVDRPRTEIHGGQVAAPVFSAIARPLLLNLGVRPERPALERWPGQQTATARGANDREFAGAAVARGRTAALGADARRAPASRGDAAPASSLRGGGR